MFEAIHKGITFIQDKKKPSRLHFAGSCCDVPGSAITGLRAEKKCIIIESEEDKYILTYNGPKNWSLIDISPQTSIQK
jgi:hypothetical protein